jgi:hypothetical protein
MIRKELRALLPLGILIFVIMAGIDLVYQPLTERVDELGWLGVNSDISAGKGGDHAFVLLVLGLLVAYSALPREHDEKTIEFLYSLPISRWQIFAGKLAAGAIVLWLGVAAEQLMNLVLLKSNPQSFSGGQWSARTAASYALLECAYVFIVLCYGLLLSFTRKFGLIALAFVGWALLFLEERAPELAYLNVTNLLTVEYYGLDIVIPWGELGLHLGLACAALGLAYALWMGPAQRLHEAYVQVHAGQGKAAIGCCGTLLVSGIVFAFFVYVVATNTDLDDANVDVHYVSWETVDAETEHYKFRYPTNLRGRALPLIAGADAAYEEVRAYLGGTNREPIVVDLTEVSGDHAGIAAWQKIRMGLVGDDITDAYLMRVFKHETTHAFQFQESDRRMGANGVATRFFAEGSAEFVALALDPDPEKLRYPRQIAIAVYTRQRIRFEDLCNGATFNVRHDTNQVYALGETWTAALVRAHGTEAVGKVLRAMAREDAPRDLAPLEFWQDTLQAAGCNLEQTLSAWEQLMKEIARDEAEFLEALPNMGGGVSAFDEDTLTLLATLDRDPIPGVTYRVRIRDDAGATDTEIQTEKGELIGDRQVVFVLFRDDLRGRTFQYQFGQHTGKDAWPYFEEWQTATVPK